jgi:hypothetical protein
MATLRRRKHKKNDRTATLPPYYNNNYIYIALSIIGLAGSGGTAPKLDYPLLPGVVGTRRIAVAL